MWRVLLCTWILFATASSWVQQPSSLFPWLLRNDPGQRHSRLFSFQDAWTAAPALEGTLIASSSISSEELSVLQELIQSSHPMVVTPSVVPLSLARLSPGATGRVANLQLDHPIEEETLEEWQAILSQQIDEILYSEEPSIRQPILLSITCNNSPEEKDVSSHMLSLIEEQISDYALADSVQSHHQAKEESSSPSSNSNKFDPTIRYEIDGAMVLDNDDDQEQCWDTSSILVFDDLVSPDLRARMMQVVLGSTKDWDDATQGPDPRRWSEGGLVDLPDDTEEEETATCNDMPPSYGLTEDALEDICQDNPPPAAFEEFETILATQLFSDFTVTRLPEAVLGAGVTPLTANAPCHGQSFQDHIDADPFFAPPSPWTDVYGRFANRARGKPRFVSCLVYLNDEWNADEWGSGTRFYDVASETAVDVSPQPGRVVIMDQDITHTVLAPSKAAGKRPRYSLVWKLILHPKTHQQDMRTLSSDWPDPIYIGSAKR